MVVRGCLAPSALGMAEWLDDVDEAADVIKDVMAPQGLAGARC